MTAHEFNRLYRVGTRVRYFPDPRNRSNFIDGTTRGEAFHLSSGASYVRLQSQPGAKPLTSIEVLDPPQVGGQS